MKGTKRRVFWCFRLSERAGWMTEEKTEVRRDGEIELWMWRETRDRNEREQKRKR